VVFFKLQLVMFFEGIRSERQLMQMAADRLSVRWYLGYDLGESLPDHSSLTRIRARYGVELFRRFFDGVVEQCQQAGLVWGKELYVDGTKVEANASVDSLQPRFFVEAHLNSLFDTQTKETDQQTSQAEARSSEAGQWEEAPIPIELPVSLSQEQQEELSQQNAQHHHWIERLGAQNRRVTSPGYQRLADFLVSTTDPDATLMETKQGSDMGYRTHYVVDGGCKLRLSSRHDCGPKSSTQFSGKSGFSSTKDLVLTLKLHRYVSPRQRDVPALRYWKDSMMLSKKAQKSSPSCTLLQTLSRLPAQHCSYWKRLKVCGKSVILLSDVG
jgi:hypothetical protein